MKCSKYCKSLVTILLNINKKLLQTSDQSLVKTSGKIAAKNVHNFQKRKKKNQWQLWVLILDESKSKFHVRRVSCPRLVSSSHTRVWSAALWTGAGRGSEILGKARCELPLCRQNAMLFLEVNEDQGSTFSPVQININIYIIHFTHFVRFCILHSWSLFLRGIGAAITDNMSDNVHLGDFCMFYFLLSDSLFRCVTWNESTFSLECCRQSVSGWVLLQGVHRQTFVWQVQIFFFASTGSLNFVHSCFVAAQVYTHTSLLHSTQTPRAFDPSAFYFQGEDANVEEMMLWLTNL